MTTKLRLPFLNIEFKNGNAHYKCAHAKITKSSVFKGTKLTIVNQIATVFTVFAVLFYISGFSALFLFPGTANAAIDPADYFIITAAGGATSMDSGATLQFTIQSLDGAGAQNPLIGADRAKIEILKSGDFSPATGVDITAVGAGLSVVEVGSGSQPYPLTSSSDISGANDNVIAVNIADGTAVGNTFTVTATESFEVFVWAEGASINDPSDSKTGQDFASITVNPSSGNGDHLAVSPSTVTTEVNQQTSITIRQENSGGGLDVGALSDVGVDIGTINFAGGGQSVSIDSSADHGLSLNDIVRFTTGAADPNALYIVSEVTDTDTFKVIGDAPNNISSSSKLTPITDGGGGLADAMSGTPGAVTANTASTIAMSSTVNMTAGSVVTIAGCTGNYIIDSVSAGTSIDVLGPTACASPTASGNVTLIVPTAGTESTYTLKNGSVYIASVGGTSTGNTTTTALAGQSLTNGSLSLVVVPTEQGQVTVIPSSATLTGTDLNGTINVGAATQLEIKFYGPPSGQIGVPPFAPVDVGFSKNPDSNNSIFPLTNSTSSVISIIDSAGNAVPGTWELFSESFGGQAFYFASFIANSPFADSTAHTVKIAKSIAPAVNLGDAFLPPLTDSGTSFDFSFTTGSGGGTFDPDAGFTGTQGGEFPPMPFLSYPMPGSHDVPTNINTIVVEFDRPMDATTFTTSNIYLKEMVSGIETDISGTPTVTPTTGTSEAAYISGYTLGANKEYRVVVTRDVKDPTGTPIAGMPLDSDGNPQQSFGFGFENMGAFKESFFTGSGTATKTATLMGMNLDKYKSGGTITGVPTTEIIRANFDAQLDPSTVTSSNVTLKKGGSVSVAGTVSYDSLSNSIEFEPAAELAANTSYTFAVSASVTSITGTAISAVSQTFTTGAADTTSPKLVFSEADNYGIFMQFDEALDRSTAEDKNNYTLKTCSGQGVNADGVKCADNTTDPTQVSLVSGVNVHYDNFGENVWIDGVMLTAGDGFYIEVSSAVADKAGNAVDSSNDTWTGTVFDAGNFFGGQGMFQMDTLGFEDFDMHDMGMNPISVFPNNSMAGVTTKYFIDVPISTQIPQGGYVELTFPSGFDVSGVKQDAQSPINNDFNGPSPGTVTFAGSISSLTNFTDGSGAQANDGIGYIDAARKVGIQLSAATQANDFLTIDLDGITNSSEPKDFDTAGYKVEIKTFDSSGTLLEALTSMPFFISPGGTNVISGSVCSAACNGSNGLNGVKVYLDSWATGFQETTTANNAAGGGTNGEFAFSVVPDGDYNIFTDPTFNAGGVDYYGIDWMPINNVTGNISKNLVVTAANSSNGATLPVTVNFSSVPDNLGYNDSVDIFASSPKGFVVKTITESSFGSPVNIFLPQAGTWNVGIGPAIPQGMFGGEMQKPEWMPPPHQDVTVATADIGGSSLSGITFSVTAADKTIAGIVKDKAGSVVTSGHVYAYNTEGGFGNESTIKKDGTFSIPVRKGLYKVGVFVPGMPPPAEKSVLVDSSGNVYVDGSPTASTGSAGANPFLIKVSLDVSGSVTVTGRVTDGTNAIKGASVWAFRTDAPSPPVDDITDKSGNYILYIPTSGSWTVEAHAPGFGFLGSKTLTVGTENITGQNFEPASGLWTVSGTVDVPGTSDDSGVMIWAHGPNGFNETTSEEDGSYKLSLPDGTYTIEGWHEDVGMLFSQTQVVDGDKTLSPAARATPQTFTVSLSEAVNEDTFIEFVDSSGMGKTAVIPEGKTSVEMKLPGGNYYVDTHVPGLPESALSIAGAEFNNVDGTPSTNDIVDIDGTGDNITITPPALQTVSGTVSAGAAAIEDAVVTVIDESTKKTFAVETDASGNYSFKVPDGNYSVLAEQKGYNAAPIAVTVSGAAVTGADFSMKAFDKSISGRVTDSAGAAVDGALVTAQKLGGGFTTAVTDENGNYTLYAEDGQFEIKAITDGFAASSALNADTTGGNVTGKNIKLPSTTVTLKNPVTKPVTKNSGGTIADDDIGLNFVIPPNAFDNTITGNVSFTVKETNKIPTTSSATPIGNAVEITAKAGNASVTKFDASDLTFEFTTAELAAEGVDSFSEVEQMEIGYVNPNTNNWVTEPTTIKYFDSGDNLIPAPTVAPDLTGVAKVKMTSSIDHLTTFAPIIPSGATPPATPTGLSATAGNGQVTLSWTANSESDMASYDIWEANVTEGVVTTLSHSSCSDGTCSKTIQSLSNGTTYSYQIIAVDTDGNKSAGSSAKSATPSAPSSGGGGGGGAVLLQSISSPQTTIASSEPSTGEITSTEEITSVGETPESQTAAEKSTSTKLSANTTQATSSAETASLSSTASAETMTPVVSGVLKQGVTGAEVRDLQEMLNRDLGTSIAVDGIFGPQTRRTVMEFQAKYNLVVDGIVGPQTRGVLNSLGVSGTRVALEIEPGENLLRGTVGDKIMTLQGILNKYLDVSLVLDGIFGPKTEAAVRQFQSLYGLIVDGIVGPQTAAAINSL